MREQELQEFVATLISERRLVDSIAGWDDVEAVALDRLQGSEKLLLLDNIVLHRAAEAALMIRDRLVHLAPVSDATRSISLDRSERLFADLLYVSPETGSVVVFEIKRARATARETITELLAYEQELRNHLPFAARTDICLVVVSTDYGPLLEHSLSSLITWHGLKILCLEVNESQEVIVRLPWGMDKLWAGRYPCTPHRYPDIELHPTRPRFRSGANRTSAYQRAGSDRKRVGPQW